jgi:uncharacterized protein YdaU (DUF1376 family)
MKFYPHHIGDYASATAHLSNEEDICYRRLLDRYYDTELPIENDLQLLARKLRVSQSSLENVLGDFFTLIDGRWHNGRADAEISHWYDKCHKAKQAIEARWAKREKDTDVLRTNNRRNTERYDLDTTQDPRPNTQEKTKTTPRASRFDAAASLSSLGVDDQIAKDWLQHRKAKRAAVTQTVIDVIVKEAATAGMALSDALSISCQRGWTGFNSGWVENQQRPAKPSYQSRNSV